MKLIKLNQNIESFYNSLQKDGAGKVIIPANLKPYIQILVALLTFIKVFTNDKTDAIIDKIINAFDNPN